MYSLGRYQVVSNDAKGVIVHITELPLGVWVIPYLTSKKSVFVLNTMGLIKEKPVDRSSDVISIHVHLIPGALEKIAEMNTGDFDDLTEFLRLRKSMKNQINLMGVDHQVCMLRSYETVFIMWFVQRRKFYKQRLERMVEIVKVDILRLTNMIRYIKEYPTLDLPSKTKEQMVEILTRHKFDRLNTEMLNPKHVATSDVVAKARGGTYKYLLGISTLGKTAKKIEELTRELAAQRTRLKDLNDELSKDVPGASIWQSELDTLQKVIDEGMRTSWQYTSYGKFSL